VWHLNKKQDWEKRNAYWARVEASIQLQNSGSTRLGDRLISGTDHYVNQVYRSFKALRSNLTLAARLEAAEQIPPLLDAIFALHGRVRPYHKYLEWELTAHPLDKISSWDKTQLLSAILDILSTAEVSSQQQIFNQMIELFTKEGYGDLFESWGENISFMQNYRQL